jgi:hypothetical protein
VSWDLLELAGRAAATAYPGAKAATQELSPHYRSRRPVGLGLPHLAPLLGHVRVVPVTNNHDALGIGIVRSRALRIRDLIPSAERPE